MALEGLLQNKDGVEKANLKGLEIAKNNSHPRSKVQFSGGDYDIEITEVIKIEGGVQCFARAWRRDGSPVGFGKDGTVEIERFIIMNPPILVPDENGSIVRKWIDVVDGSSKETRFTEDPTKAIHQSIAHSVSVVGKDGENIIPGKRGNTTLTAYPAAGTNSPVDGFTARDANDSTFSTIVGETTADDSSATVVNGVFGLRSSGTTNQYHSLHRSVLGFDTSSIGGGTVDSATLSLYGSTTTIDALGDTPQAEIVSSSPASDSDVVDGDYDSYGTTLFATGIDIDSWSDSSYNDFTLNASGEGHIDGGGNTFFGTRLNWDVSGTFGGTWASNTWALMRFLHADTAGTSTDPKLVVEYTESVGGSTPTPQLLTLGVG